MRKPVFGVSDQVQHKLDCIATEDVTAQLICTCVFTHAMQKAGFLMMGLKLTVLHRQPNIFASHVSHFALKRGKICSYVGNMPASTVSSTQIQPRMGTFFPRDFSPISLIQEQ